MTTTNLLHPLQFKYALLNALVLLGSSLFLLLVVYQYPPYKLPQSNALYAAALAGCTWVNLCTLAVVLASQTENKESLRMAAMIAFYVGVIPIMMLGQIFATSAFESKLHNQHAFCAHAELPTNPPLESSPVLQPPLPPVPSSSNNYTNIT